MILQPLGRRWIFQPWKQDAFKYIYFPDTAQLRKYIDPEQFYRERDKKYLVKKGKARVKLFEITGGVDSDYVFFLHPPRTNQYRIITNLKHHSINKLALDENISKKYGSYLQTYGSTGKLYDMNYITKPIKNFIYKNEDLGTCWEIYGESIVDGILNTSFVSCYSLKYGFIYINYQIQNKVEINFQLTEVEKL